MQIEVDFSILKEKIELSVIYFCQGFPIARTTINPCCGDFPTHRCDHTAKAINKNGKSAEITIPSKVIWILLCIPYTDDADDKAENKELDNPDMNGRKLSAVGEE